MNITTILIAALVACNLWFAFLLLYDRIAETTLFRFFRKIAEIWRSVKADGTKEETDKPSPVTPAVDVVGKSRFKMPPKQTMTAIPTQEAATSGKAIEMSVEDVTFADENKEKYPAQVPADRMDEVFTNIDPSEMEYSDDEPEEDMTDRPQASGNSFDDIDEAVRTAKNPKATEQEKERAANVFTDMEGTELYDKLMEGSPEMSIRIKGLIEIRMKTRKKEFVIPESVENFDIRDYV